MQTPSISISSHMMGSGVFVVHDGISVTDALVIYDSLQSEGMRPRQLNLPNLAIGSRSCARLRHVYTDIRYVRHSLDK